MSSSNFFFSAESMIEFKSKGDFDFENSKSAYAITL